MSDWDVLTEEPDTGSCDICGRLREDHADPGVDGYAIARGRYALGKPRRDGLRKNTGIPHFLQLPVFSRERHGRMPKVQSSGKLVRYRSNRRASHHSVGFTRS